MTNTEILLERILLGTGPKWSTDTENRSVEKKSQGNNCSEDIFKAQSEGALGQH